MRREFVTNIFYVYRGLKDKTGFVYEDVYMPSIMPVFFQILEARNIFFKSNMYLTHAQEFNVM